MNRATRQKLILIRDYLNYRRAYLHDNGARAYAKCLLAEIEQIQDALAGRPILGFTLPPCIDRDIEIVDGPSSPSMASSENLERRIANLEWLIERQAKDIDSLRTRKRKRPATIPNPT